MKAKEQIKNDEGNVSLTDLSVTDEQANQTKGGPFNNFRVQYVFTDFEDVAR